MTMTHKQRIENAIALKASDRIPYALWMHNPNKDRHPKRLAELSLNLQKKYDMDFIKFTPYGMYQTIDMGADLDVFPGFRDAPVLHKSLINYVKDWDKLRPVCGKSGEFTYCLEGQRMCHQMLEERVPLLQTVFSPLTVALKICNPKILAQHIKEDPYRVHRALEMFMDTLIQFMKASVDLGADGFFYATQVSSRDLLTEAENEEFCRKYDLEVLNTVKNSTWFNILHLHGTKVYIDKVEDYPVQGINWHDRDEGPSMEEVRKFSSKALVGGLTWGAKWKDMDKADIAAEVRDAASKLDGKGIIVGPGCVVDPDTPHETMALVQKTVEETARK